MIERANQEAVRELRSHIIKSIGKYPERQYLLAGLLWDEAAACFPGGPFRWDLADFCLDLISHKLSAKTAMYPNQFGSSPEHIFDLTPAQFHAIAVARGFSPTLCQMETDQDWESLFDDELNAAVTVALEKVREAERLQKAVPISKSFCGVAPKMELIHIFLKKYSEYWVDTVELTRENGSYRLSCRDVIYSFNINNVHVRTATPAESAWIEEQVMSAVTAPDSLSQHPVGKMDVVIEAEQYRVKREEVIPLEQYEELYYKLSRLTTWGSKEAQ